MKIRTSAAALVAVGALGLALAPSAALAHDGNHPFENCTEAYKAGYKNIGKSDRHYGKHLDRDGDGIGCDKPPADFVPAEDGDGGNGAGEEEAGKGGGLAETGGNSSTPYIAGAGGLVLAAGAGVLVVTRKRRTAG